MGTTTRKPPNKPHHEENINKYWVYVASVWVISELFFPCFSLYLRHGQAGLGSSYLMGTDGVSHTNGTSACRGRGGVGGRLHWLRTGEKVL